MYIDCSTIQTVVLYITLTETHQTQKMSVLETLQERGGSSSEASPTDDVVCDAHSYTYLSLLRGSVSQIYH